MTEFLSVYITAPTREEAEKIAHVLVEEKLAACANIFPGLTSIYSWQGNVEQAQECAMIVKISADRFDALSARVREIHSYECPCIVAWPIAAGDADYLKWLRNPE